MAMVADRLTWVFINECGSTGEANGEDIVMSVGVKVMNPREEVICVRVHGLRFCRIDLMGLFEVRSSEPVGAVDHVHMGVSVEISHSGTFAEIGLREGLALKGVHRALWFFGW
jgi:hypothetical protein